MSADQNNIITSRDNAKLKLARAVRDGREAGLVFVEGVRLVDEAVRSSVEMTHIFVSTDHDLQRRFAESIELHFVEPKIFRSIADTENPQGLIALVRRPSGTLEEVATGVTVLLHRVNNPSNLGAVVRTAEAAGVSGLITTTGSADAFSPKALRASMGSAFRLPIIEGIHFDDAITWARERGLVSTAADISGKLSYLDLDWTVSRLVVFGSEAHGLDDRELASIDEKILIPMENEVESLNLAVSSGIILFEAKRQRTG
jgi:TrmH family RNA methyltransferase